MPQYLKETYEEALMDPDLGAMRDSIALMDAFIAEYLAGLMRTPSVETIRAVVESMNSEHFYSLIESFEDGPTRELTSLVNRWKGQLSQVVKSRSEEQEVRRAIKERAELVKVEAMRVDKSSRYITVEQAMALIAALAQIVNKYVESESERRIISQKLDRIIDRGSVETDKSGGAGPSGTPQLPATGKTEADATGHPGLVLSPEAERPAER